MGLFDGAENVGKVVSDVVDGRAPLGSSVLDAGRLLIAGMRGTIGSGTPEHGESFRHGAVRFSVAAEAVNAAYPGGEWHGAGAEAYAAANRRQSDRAMSMAVLDRDVQTVIAREADQVAYHRARLDDQSEYLGGLSYATSSIARIPGVGEAMKAVFELSAVKSALSVSSAELDKLSLEVGDNAAHLQQLAGEYSALTESKAAPVEPDDVPGRPASDEPPASEPVDSAAEQSLPVAEPLRIAEVTPELPPTHVTGGAAPLPADRPVPPAPTSAMPTDAMSGMSSAFGLVGGMIGSMVAPMAAVMTGVAGAAGQSLSALTSAGGADTGGSVDDEAVARTPADDPADDGSDRDVDTADSDVGAGGAASTGVAESPGSPPLPRGDVESGPPPAPPAPTRPPQ
ncbi:MAG: EspA/EspE family type VII secretion system effector [Mycobacterium sp.]